MNNKCPKCGYKLKPLYMKQECPNCHVNLMYYNLDENLKADEQNAKEELKRLWTFVNKIDKAHLVKKYCDKKGIKYFWE